MSFHPLLSPGASQSDEPAGANQVRDLLHLRLAANQLGNRLRQVCRTGDRIIGCGERSRGDTLFPAWGINAIAPVN